MIKTNLSCLSYSHVFPDLSATCFVLAMHDLRSTCGFPIGGLDLQPGTARNWVDPIETFPRYTFRRKEEKEEEEGFSHMICALSFTNSLFQKHHHHRTIHFMLMMILGHTFVTSTAFLRSFWNLCNFHTLFWCSVMFPDLWWVRNRIDPYCMGAEVPGVWGLKRRIPPVLGGAWKNGKRDWKVKLPPTCDDCDAMWQDATTCYWSFQQRSGKRRSAERERFAYQ